MLKVIFYILQGNEESDFLHYSCRLIEKVFLAGHKVFVLCDSLGQANKVNELLWSFKMDSFVPHVVDYELDQNNTLKELPVLISSNISYHSDHDVIISLARERIQPSHECHKLLHIVNQDESRLKASRTFYRFYQQMNYNTIIHNI
jgi:DNA polymerase III subunit chi